MILFQAVSKEKHIALEVNAEPGLTFPADEDKVHQVLSNFLSNALKFTPAGGKVVPSATLSKGPPGAEGPARYVRFSFADTGPGVAPQEQARLFNRFEQAKGLRDRNLFAHLHPPPREPFAEIILEISMKRSYNLRMGSGE